MVVCWLRTCEETHDQRTKRLGLRAARKSGPEEQATDGRLGSEVRRRKEEEEEEPMDCSLQM
jgi:hypothetical protein